MQFKFSFFVSSASSFCLYHHLISLSLSFLHLCWAWESPLKMRIFSSMFFLSSETFFNASLAAYLKMMLRFFVTCLQRKIYEEFYCKLGTTTGASNGSCMSRDNEHKNSPLAKNRQSPITQSLQRKCLQCLIANPKKKDRAKTIKCKNAWDILSWDLSLTHTLFTIVVRRSSLS